MQDYWSDGRIGFILCEVIWLRLWWKSTQSLTGRALCWRCHVPPTSSCRVPLTEIEDEASEWLTGAGWMRSVVTEGVEPVELLVEGGGWRWTHAGPEVRGVQLRVVLVLHGVIHAVALPHQVVMSAQDGGVNFGQIWEENSNMTKIMFVVKVF